VKSHLSTGFIAGFVLTLALAACGADSDDPTDEDTIDPTTAAEPADTPQEPTTTAAAPDPGDPATTSTTGPTAPTVTPAPQTPFVRGTITTGSVSNSAGATVEWALAGDTGELCFGAELSTTDPTAAAALGDGVSDCLRPDGGLDDIDGALSVSVGVVDGERTFGYLWGRVDATIISLSIEHTDGSQTIIDLFDGPSDTRVFAIVVDTTAGPPVESIDAVSGTQIEASQPIRSFLRSGPTYPVTAPTTTTPIDLYPTVG